MPKSNIDPRKALAGRLVGFSIAENSISGQSVLATVGGDKGPSVIANVQATVGEDK
jgi:hypothetical protein